jgi:hypothetical protein
MMFFSSINILSDFFRYALLFLFFYFLFAISVGFTPTFIIEPFFFASGKHGSRYCVSRVAKKWDVRCRLPVNGNLSICGERIDGQRTVRGERIEKEG